MPSIEELLTAVYVFVDDYLKAHPRATQWRTSNHSRPQFSDAEVLTLGVLQGCLGTATLKQAYAFAAGNRRGAFPHLPNYPRWVARLHALSGITGQLLQVAGARAALGEAFFLLDSKPSPSASRPDTVASVSSGTRAPVSARGVRAGPLVANCTSSSTSVGLCWSVC